MQQRLTYQPGSTHAYEPIGLALSPLTRFGHLQSSPAAGEYRALTDDERTDLDNITLVATEHLSVVIFGLGLI